jgi:hypothetical protein
MDTVVIATLPDIVTALSLHEILVDAGIECQLVHGSETVFPTDTIDAHALIVRTEDAERARALLDEVEAAAEAGYAAAGVDEAEAAAEAECAQADEGDPGCES